MGLKFKLLAIPALVLGLGLGACAELKAPAPILAQVCGKVPAVAVLALDAQDPHSTLGVLWADVKAGCDLSKSQVSLPVSPVWMTAVWSMFKDLLPKILPNLLPLLG